MSTVRILFDLRSGFGIGDAVQSSIMWQHLKKYRPSWMIDVRAPGAFSAAIKPFVHAFWPSEGPDSTGEYESVQALGWTDVFETFPDRPSTKVAYALKNVFGIQEYDPALGRYEVIPEERHHLSPFEIMTVAYHVVGNSHPERKNLSSADGRVIWDEILRLGCKPENMVSSRFCNYGVGLMKSCISRCAAFVGIDSGPGKIASCTDTPTLICWTGHHPLRYHDPAPNTTHLLPQGWSSTLPPFDDHGTPGNFAALDFFNNNYQNRTYRPGELAQEACRWLREVLS